MCAVKMRARRRARNPVETRRPRASPSPLPQTGATVLVHVPSPAGPTVAPVRTTPHKHRACASVSHCGDPDVRHRSRRALGSTAGRISLSLCLSGSGSGSVSLPGAGMSRGQRRRLKFHCRGKGSPHDEPSASPRSVCGFTRASWPQPGRFTYAASASTRTHKHSLAASSWKCHAPAQLFLVGRSTATGQPSSCQPRSPGSTLVYLGLSCLPQPGWRRAEGEGGWIPG